MTKPADQLHGDDSTYWEKVANTRWGAYTTDVLKRGVLKAHDLSDKPAIAFEIGCDGGRWSRLLTDLGWQMTCTDVSEEVLTKCKQRVPAANCILANPNDTELPCTSVSFDLLLCVEVCEVIQSDWFINEAYRVLKDNKLVIGVFWNLLSFRGLIKHVVSKFNGSFDWYKIAYPFWRQKLINRGFRILYEEGYCWFPFSRDSNSALVPLFTDLEKKIGLRKLVSVSPWIVFIAQKRSESNPE